MPLVQTRGAASAQGFGEFAQASAPVYIEDVFSTYLYTGNGVTGQSINNGIDLSGKGGFVWIKDRDQGFNHFLFDTVRGTDKALNSNTTDAQGSGGLMSATSTGFSFSGNTNGNQNTVLWASWTFRKQPKFFDVVTYTGTGVARTVAHNLGSVPGCIIVKRTDTAGFDWAVYHVSTGNTNRLLLNDTVPAAADSGFWNNTTPTSSVFTVGSNVNTNGSGGTYVAYIFAHNAGGFGLTGTDNVISCGSFTATGGNVAVNLGYEPQWVLVKNASSAENWRLLDNMRGISAADTKWLFPNTSGVETSNSNWNSLTATGINFLGWGSSGNTYIYIACRRGPMKVPTLGTSVFSPVFTATASETVNTVGFVPDMQLIKQTGNAVGTNAVDRLRGVSGRYQYNDGRFLLTSSAAVESSNYSTQYWNNTGFSTPFLTAGISTIYLTFGRAPGFFDEVCYTGGSPYNRAHNLTVVPELMIVKCRDTGYDWAVYSSALGNTKYLSLSSTAAAQTDTDIWSSTTPTATTFYGGPNSYSSGGGALYVAYLFATCAGVSKVGSYSGNTGVTVTVPCGFTSGVRFVLIKRTDSTGDWYVWDSARGIIPGNDPYLLLNSTAAEVGGTDYVDTYSAGFEVTSTAPAGLNATGGTYIFLAIA